MVYVLGIESSCDETAIAVVDDTRQIISHVIRSQTEAHQPFGGVVPEIAARAHIEWMEPLLTQTLQEADLSMDEMDAIAVTAGPGLIGGVIVGVMTAKTLCAIHRKPLIGINHLEAHALTPRLSDDVDFPYLLLLVSGGHFFYAIVKGLGDIEILGSTIDDALGEAFDKCAKMMALPYPGGPQIEQLAKQGDATRFALPRPLLNVDGCDVSFSGLKTAVRYALKETLAEGSTELAEQTKADMAACFQDTVIDILTTKTKRAINAADDKGYDKLPLVIAGGVAANQAINAALRQLAAEHEMEYIAPPPALCTDNGAMIAWAGVEYHLKGHSDPLTLEPRARWPLGDMTPAG